MANPHRGEVRVTLDGTDYTIVFDINAIAEAEERSGYAYSVLELRLKAGYFSAARVLLWAALRAHHPKISLQDAGALLGDHADDIRDGLVKAIGLAFPPEEEAAPVADPPPAAPVSHGRKSKKKRSRQASPQTVSGVSPHVN